MNEFEIIEKYFTGLGPVSAEVTLGVGDDCALLSLNGDVELAVTVDNLVLDRHFDSGMEVADVAYKAVAVSVSDLAAMGATPRFMTLALTLPEVNASWLRRFSQGLREGLECYGVSLIGGNLCRGPLNIASQLMGAVARGKALKRSGAKPGDAIYVSGRIGDAALGLRLHTKQLTLPKRLQNDATELLAAWYRPFAQVVLGQRLVAQATACIDISDGLLADLTHLLRSSGVGASVQLQSVPLYPHLTEILQPAEPALQQSDTEAAAISACLAAVSGGEDYQLCFTLPENDCAKVEKWCASEQIQISRIGVVEANPGLRLHYGVLAVQTPQAGYLHF